MQRIMHLSDQKKTLSNSFYAAIWLLLLGVCLALILQYPLRVNDDVGFNLEVGSFLRDGARPYIDYIDINFPTIHLLSVIPVVVSDALNVHVIPVFMIGTWLLIIMSCALSWFLARRVFKSDSAYLVWLLPIAIVAQSLFFLWDGSNGVMMYGEREHFFILFFMPYVLLRWSRAQGVSAPAVLAFGLGMLAALAVSIKPQFAPIYFSFEVVLLLLSADRRRMLRTPEIWGIVVFSLLYLGWWLFHLDSAIVYFTEVLPSVRGGYDAYGHVPPVQLLLQSVDMLVLLVVMAYAARAARFEHVRLLLLLGALTFGALLTYAVQGKGWPYHSIPYLFFRSAFFGLVLYFLKTELLDKRPHLSVRAVRIRAVVLPGVVALVAVVLLVRTSTLTFRTYLSESIRDVILRYSEPDDPILILETAVGWTYPVLQQTGRRQASRYMVPHPLAFAYYNRDITNVYEANYQDPPLAQAYLESLVEDIRTNAPRLIFINSQNCSNCRVNPLQLLEARGILSNVIVPQYERLGTLRQFEVYRRRDSA